MTSVLLISDIHANLAALEAVVRHAEKNGGFDGVWSLGDAVGYGPQPNECLAKIRSLGALAISGNHEHAALRRISLGDFNPYARSAAQWTAKSLTPESAAYLESLPLRALAHEFTLVHGSPRDPVWEYLADEQAAEANISYFETADCANGHTHIPAVLMVADGVSHTVHPAHGELVELGDARCFVNPGSVGQPRDGNPRASYALLNVERREVVFRRVEYPVAETQRLMHGAGLPSLLIERLSRGW
jgi:diadenosine tetraphosphatase ApaH/serine/threonine PP2A family protein phosphatase